MDGDVDFSPDSESFSMDMTASEPAPSAETVASVGVSVDIGEVAGMEGVADIGGVDVSVDAMVEAEIGQIEAQVTDFSSSTETYLEDVADISVDHGLFPQERMLKKVFEEKIDKSTIYQSTAAMKLQAIAKSQPDSAFGKICEGLADTMMESASVQLTQTTVSDLVDKMKQTQDDGPSMLM